MSSSHFITLSAAALMALSAVGCNQKSIAPQQPAKGINEMASIFEQPVPAAIPQLPTTGVVATVNGVEITAEAVMKEVNTALARMQRQLPPEQLAQMAPRIQQEVLDQLVARQLLLQEANRQQLEISDEEFDEARTKLEATLPPGMTLEQILAQRNVSEEQFRKDFADEMRIGQLIEAATSNKVQVTDEEVDAFYKENSDKFEQPETATARHILIAVTEGDNKDEKKAKAEGIRERLLAGEDFATVASVETDDPGSKATGGEYTFPRGRMVPEFEEAAFTQDIGAVGPLVETQFGYHIIKVEKREDARVVPLEEVRSNLVQYLRSRKMPAVVQEYIADLRSNAEVSVVGED